MEDSTPTPDPTPPTPTPPAPRRKNYSDEDDLVLLRQALADLPFEAQRGGVIEAWDGVVARVLSDPSFGIRTATGKSGQARFNKLIERHRARDRAALLASGVEEEYGEREQLLDELTSRVDEHARPERERSDAEKARLGRLATAGDVVREQALTRMREDPDARDETPAKQARLTQLLTFLREDAQREAASRHAEFERQLEERRAEREAEREERREERRNDHDKMMALFKGFMEALALAQK